MKRERRWLAIIVCLLALSTNSIETTAQEEKPVPKKVVTKDVKPGELKSAVDETFKVLAAKFVSGKIVKGAPYSATATTETIQTLSDGNQIIRRNESKVYRDHEGRTRIDQTLETIGKWTAAEAQHRTFINDPVTDSNYSLDPRTRTVHKRGGGERTNLKIGVPKDKRSLEAANNTLEQRKLSNFPDKRFGPAKPPEMGKLKEAMNPDGRRKTESLGTQIIEGVEAEGVRATLTIPAGEIGNTLPIEVVDETWYSHELQVMVMTSHRDPRSGVMTYRLTNLNRSEPDHSLFEIPADYTVVDPSDLKKGAMKSEAKKKPREL